MAVAGRGFRRGSDRAGLVANACSHPEEGGRATIHGGPFPATTDSRFTSVGMTAIDRFLRPVT
ncbi:hypothetical protein [Streptomyces adustus]|uniref:hypothetical protein n=1 Tax=Streptomyces adustus TaxID=1609272 RepID=UPI00371A0651